jgi:hypothetical protein
MDRRVVIAVVLMMAIAMLPVLFASPRLGGFPGSPAAPPRHSAAATSPAVFDSPWRSAGRVVRVTGPLYTFGISTRGGWSGLLSSTSRSPGRIGAGGRLRPERD